MLTRCLLALALMLPGFAAAENVSLKHQGLTLNANLEMAPGKSMKDGVILMTHGTLAHGRMEIMAALQETMKARGYNSLSINLSYANDNRAYAMYDCAQPHAHRHEDAVGEIGAWVDWLKTKGAAKIAVLGHSRGGNQTAWYAAGKPDAAVNAVILIAPGSWTADYLAKDYRSRFGQELGPVLAKARAAVKAGKGASPLAKTGVVYCKDAQTTAASLVSYHGFDPRMETFKLLGKIRPPVLVIAGSADETTPGVAEKAKPHADGKHVSLVGIEGADHFFRDLYADEAADAIGDFLKKQAF